jgi:hypothetical protein
MLAASHGASMRLIAIGTALTLAACTKASPTSPPSIPDISGSWSGTIAGTPTVGAATLAFTLVQALADSTATEQASVNSLTGTWSISFANPAYNTSGSLTGLVSSDLSMSAHLGLNAPDSCALNLAGTLAGTTTILGISIPVSDQVTDPTVGVTCTTFSSGPFSVMKR